MREQRWQSARMRVRDGIISEMVESGELGEDDVPPDMGEHQTDEYGVNSVPMVFGSRNPIPPVFRFHSTSRAAWRNVAQEQYVPYDDNLASVQGTVSAGRVAEIRQDPDSASSGRLPYEELPRVFHDPVAGKNYIVDGNHRAMAQKADGRLFFRAQVADESMTPEFNDRYRRLLYARQGAEETHDLDAVQNDLGERWEPSDTMWREAAHQIRAHNPPTPSSPLPRRSGWRGGFLDQWTDG